MGEYVAARSSEWEVLPFGSLAKECRRTSHADAELLSVYLDRGVIRYSESSGQVHKPSLDLSAYQLVKPGDLVLNNQQAWRGSVGVSDYTGIVSPAYVVCSLSDRIVPGFARYLFRAPSMVGQYVLASKGVGSIQRNLVMQQLRRAPVPLPAAPEQQLIARFLDQAELRIANAIQAKQQLVALLRERRRVIVEEHVLRGVSDVNAGSLVSSEVPWLGMVPESWSLTPFRGVFSPRRKIVGQQSHAFTLLSLTLNGVIVRDLTQLKGKFPASFDSYQEVRVGDLVMCLFDVDETPRTVGLSQHDGMITGAYDVFAARDPLVARFAELQLLALDAGKKLKPLYRGLRKVVPTSSLAGAPLCIPPRHRIEGIIEAVATRTASTDRALSSLDSEIELLREYRARLISDVVTGGKDVRAEARRLRDVDPVELASVLVGTADADPDDLGEADDVV